MIDRCGRIGMLMALCVFYPQYLFVLQLFVSLEVAGCFSNHYRYRPVCSLVLDSLFLEITMLISLCKGRSLLRVNFIKQQSYVRSYVTYFEDRAGTVLFFDVYDFQIFHNRCTLMTQPNSILQKKMHIYDPWLMRIFFQEVR